MRTYSFLFAILLSSFGLVCVTPASAATMTGGDVMLDDPESWGLGSGSTSSGSIEMTDTAAPSDKELLEIKKSTLETRSDMYNPFYSIRLAQLFTEEEQIGFEETTWVALKMSYDAGPAAVLLPNDYEIRVYTDKNHGVYRFDPTITPQTVATHKIGRKTPYIDNSLFRVSTTEENKYGANGTNYITLRSKDPLVRGTTRTILLSYTSAPGTRFDFTAQQAEITARVWTYPSIDENKRYDDNKKSVKITLSEPAEPYTLTSFVPKDQDFIVLPADGSLTGALMNMTVKVRNRTQSMLKDVTLRGFLSNDEQETVFDKPAQIPTLADGHVYAPIQTTLKDKGFSIDAHAYRSFTSILAPITDPAKSKEKLFFHWGLFQTGSTQPIATHTNPIEFRRDAAAVDVEWVNRYWKTNVQQSDGQVKNIFGLQFVVQNTGTRTINSYTGAVLACFDETCSCDQNNLQIGSFALSSLDVNNKVRQSVQIATNISPESFHSYAVWLRPTVGENTQNSFCLSTKDDLNAWTQSYVSALKIDTFKITAEPLQSTVRGNEASSWKITVHQSQNVTLPEHKLQLVWQLKSKTDPEKVLWKIESPISIKNFAQKPSDSFPTEFQTLIHGIIPKWPKTAQSPELPYFFTFTLSDVHGTLGNIDVPITVSEPSLPITAEQDIASKLTIGKRTSFRITLRDTKNTTLSDTLSFSTKSALICGQKVIKTTSDTPFSTQEIKTQGFQTQDVFVDVPQMTPQSNCSIITTLTTFNGIGSFQKFIQTSGITLEYGASRL